jgi:hypothetical protein
MRFGLRDSRDRHPQERSLDRDSVGEANGDGVVSRKALIEAFLEFEPSPVCYATGCRDLEIAPAVPSFLNSFKRLQGIYQGEPEVAASRRSCRCRSSRVR